MSKEFQRYVESTRDCDGLLLDIAVKKGLARGKSGGLDLRKLISLAAMCAATAALCITIRLSTETTASFVFNNSLITQSSAEQLHRYINGGISVASEYLVTYNDTPIKSMKFKWRGNAK